MAGFLNSLMARLESRLRPYGTAHLAATLVAALVLALDPWLKTTYFGLATPRQLLLGLVVLKQFRPGRSVITALLIAVLLEVSCAKAFDHEHGTQVAIVLGWTMAMLPSISEGWVHGQTADYDFKGQLGIWVAVLFAFSFNSAGWLWREEVGVYVLTNDGARVFVLIVSTILVALPFFPTWARALIMLFTYGLMYLANRIFWSCFAAIVKPLTAWQNALIHHLHGDISKFECYAHEPLRPGHIRILRIHRRRLSQPLRVDVAQYKIDEAPSYEALSYRWDANNRKELVLVGRCVVEVMQPVYQFLLYRRSWWTSPLVWIDSVCIDQSPGLGDKEKEAQIPLMGTVFSRASRVISWLGYSSGSSRAYDTILYLAEKSDAFHRHPEAEATKLVSGYNPGWKELADFFADPYFKRVWVYQEVVLARELHIVFGGVCMKWETILRVVNIVRHPNLEVFLRPSNREDRDAILGVVNAAAMLASRNRAPQVYDLNEILESSVPMQATKPHDKVYAIFGMIDRNHHKDPIAPRYDLPVEEVYRSTMIHVLSTTKSLHLLHLAGLGRQQDRRLPSWVPDFAQQKIQALHVGMKPKFHAGMKLQSVVHFPDPGTTWIQVAGNQVDRVVEVSPSGIETEQPYKLLSEWMKQVDRMAVACASTNANFDSGSIRMTITMNRFSANTALSVETYAAFRWWLGLDLRAGEAAPYTYLSESQLQDPKMDVPHHARGPALGVFSRAALGIIYHWPMVRTARGCLAAAPQGTKVGDVVCIIWGTQTPYVLRGTTRRIGGKFAFELMGCAYVLEYMDGSAADGRNRDMFSLV
jgi:hypothetical protein